MTKYRPSPRLYLGAGVALLGALSVGFTIGFPDPAYLTLVIPEVTTHDSCINATATLKRLDDSQEDELIDANSKYSNDSFQMQWSNAFDTRFKITGDQNSWNSAIMPLTALFGAMVGGPISDYIGRRLTLIAIGIPFSLGWILIGFSFNLAMLLTGRGICGFFTGLICSVVPPYIVEISTPQTRGSLGTCFQILITVGIFITSFFGVFATEKFNYFFRWDYIAFIGAIPSAVMSIGMIRMPESHVWILVKSGKGKAAAESALARLRADSGKVKEELEELEKSTSQQNTQFSLGDFSKPIVWKPLILALGLMFFQQLSGINAVMFYLNDIFTVAGLGEYTAAASAFVKFVQVIATVSSSFFIDRLGRKKLLIASGVGHTVSLIAFAVYFVTLYDKCGGSTGSFAVKAVPVACLLIYIVAFSIGFGPIPWLMIAEMTPSFARGAVGSMATVLNWTAAFVVGMAYQPIQALIKPEGAFGIFAGMCLVSIGFVQFFLPETKGKTFDEIVRIFGGKASAKKSEAQMAAIAPKQSKERTVPPPQWKDTQEPPKE